MGAFFQGVKGWSHLSSSKNDCSYLQLYVLLGRFRDRRVSDTFVGVSHVNYTALMDRIGSQQSQRGSESRAETEGRRTKDTAEKSAHCHGGKGARR